MTTTEKKKESQSTSRHLPGIDAAPTRLFMDQWACWAIIRSSLCPAANTAHPKYHLHLWIFLLAPRIFMSSSCLGGKVISIHSLYPFPLQHSLDLCGAFGIGPTHTLSGTNRAHRRMFMTFWTQVIMVWGGDAIHKKRKPKLQPTANQRPLNTSKYGCENYLPTIILLSIWWWHFLLRILPW